MKRFVLISLALTACTTYGDPSLLGGVKSQWRADDKVVVVANVNAATAMTKGSTYATEMSLFRAAKEAKGKGYSSFYAVDNVEQQLAMELRGELPIPAEKGMKPVAASHPSGYKNTIYVMTSDASGVGNSANYSVEDVLQKYNDKFGKN